MLHRTAPFRTAAELFQLIDDRDTVLVVVRYEARRDDIDSWLAILKVKGPERWLMRKLQRFTVSIRQRDADLMLNDGSVELAMPGLYAQLAATTLYDPDLGLRLRKDLFDPGGNAF